MNTAWALVASAAEPKRSGPRDAPASPSPGAASTSPPRVPTTAATREGGSGAWADLSAVDAARLAAGRLAVCVVDLATGSFKPRHTRTHILLSILLSLKSFALFL